MSAFMVPQSHINAMVEAWYHYSLLADRCFNPRAPKAEIARMLIRENRASINYRYPDTIGAPDREPGMGGAIDEAIEVKPLSKMPTRIEAWQMINCYEYQACEHPDWETSRAKKWCEQFRRALVESLPSYPEYAAKAPYVWESA